MQNDYRLAVYSKCFQVPLKFADFINSNHYQCTVFSVKSYNLQNYVLENSDLLVILDELCTPDVKLIIKRFHDRNIPILFYTNNSAIIDDVYAKLEKKSDISEKKELKLFKKVCDLSDGIITSLRNIKIKKEFITFGDFIPSKDFSKKVKINSKTIKNEILIFHNKKLPNDLKERLDIIAKNYCFKIILKDKFDISNITLSKIFACLFYVSSKNYYTDSLYFPFLYNNVPLISTKNNLYKDYKKSPILFVNSDNDLIKTLTNFADNKQKQINEQKNASIQFLKNNFSSEQQIMYFHNQIGNFIKNYQLKNGKPSSRASKINFAKEMKANNKKYRLEIFTFLKPHKKALQYYLINILPHYKKYILKMSYDELTIAKKELEKGKQPKILNKFSQKYLTETRTPRICKMINNISKNPEYPLDEIVFYIIKDIPSTHHIFKNEKILFNFIKEFCDLTYLKDYNGQTIFTIKEYNKKLNRIYDIPDTYNVREVLSIAFSSNDNYLLIYKLISLCQNETISIFELYNIAYLIKHEYLYKEIIEYVLAKNYITDKRLDFTKISNDYIEKYVKNKKTKTLLKIQKTIPYKPKHFFINIEGYGKNEDWGKRVAQLTDKIVFMVKEKAPANDILSEISFYTRQNAMINKRDKGDMDKAAVLRCISPDDYKGGLVTPYDYKSRYGGRYSKKFAKFKDKKNELKSPYKKLMLTRIQVSKKDKLAGKMIHVPSVYTAFAILQAEKLYKQIIKYLNCKLTDEKFAKVVNLIAEIHWILAHNAPWGRGSDSITNIYIKAILKALNIKVGPLKKNISLDLEAFCTELDIYKKNYTKYYSLFKYINK